MVHRSLDWFIHYASGEWMLPRFTQGNSGNVVLARSLQISLLAYAGCISLRALFSPDTLWEFDGKAFGGLVFDTLPWLGAIFAASYAALYARFSSQWNYVASLYNQIMASKAAANGQTESDTFIKWQAAFIEDAQDLHLATKPMFASVIHFMLKNRKIESAFVKYSAGGQARLASLRPQISRSRAITKQRYRAAN